MLSSRRIAQLGLFSASLILVGSVTVLVLGGAESSPAQPVASGATPTPSNTLSTFQAQIPQPTVGKH